MVVCAAPTQSCKAEHSEKALPTDKVYLKLMGAKLLSATSLMPFYVEEDGVAKPFNFGTDVEEAEVLLTTRLRYMKAYINILSGPNVNNEIPNIETDDASVYRCVLALSKG